MDGILRDLRISFRTLLHKPSFLIAAVLVLASGIGATVAIFSFIHAFVLHPLDLAGADRMVQLWEASKEEGWAKREVAPGNFLDWKSQNHVFDHLASYQPTSFNLASRGEPERLAGANVSADFFRVLGLTPASGRDFLPNEDAAGAPRVAVISDNLWRRHFGADPAMLGKSFMVNGQSCVVVGVLPPSFHLPHLGHADIWVPFAFDAGNANDRVGRGLYVLGHLRPGVTAQGAQADMSSLAARLAQQHPRPDGPIGVLVIPLEVEVAQSYRPSLLILLIAAGCLLLLACANVANLQLARTSTRVHEISVRVALGVTRPQLIRQLFLESVLVALLGGVLALVVARASIALMTYKLPPDVLVYVPHYGRVPIDGSVLLFSLAAALATAVLFGLVPAVRASRPQVGALLKGAGRASAGRHARRGRSLLMVSEVALALTLLVTSALMLKSFGRLQRVDPGFQADRVLTTELELPQATYGTPALEAQFYQRALERVEHLPGVDSAAVVNHVPMGGSNYSGTVTVEGSPEKGDWQFSMVRSCSPDYFRVLRIPVDQGRAFTPQDTAASRRVVIVNEAVARHFWPNGSALGKRLKRGRLDSDNPWMEVVGVVGNVKQWALNDNSTAQIYQPMPQWTPRSAAIVVRTVSDRPAAVAQSVRREVLAVDPQEPLGEFKTMRQLVSNSLLLQAMSVILIGFFGTIALVVGAIGIFSVVYYLTLQRTHEFGVRMALGASRGNVIQLVLSGGLRLVAIGLAIGAIAAFGAASAMGGLLYGVSAGDLSTYAGAALFLAVVAALAIYLPARQAGKVSPALSTRYE